MKVILLQDVKSLGRKGEVKEVNQGHANNFLIPKKLVRPATDNDAVAALNKIKEKEVHDEVRKELMNKAFMELKGKGVTIYEKANEKGHFFSQVHKSEVVKAIKDQLKIEVEEDWVILSEPIKEVGERSVVIKNGNLKEEITLSVEAK